MVGFTLGKRAGVNHIKSTQASFHGPVQAGVLVFDIFRFKTLDLVVITQVWIGIKCAVAVDFLDHGANAHTPIIVHVPQCADSPTGVAGIVKVIFN